MDTTRNLTHTAGHDRSWPTAKLKYVARFAYGDSLSSTEGEDGPIPVFGSNGAYASTAEPNTVSPVIVVGRKGSYGKVNWSSRPVFAQDTTFFIDRTTTAHDLRWLFWTLQTLGLDTTSDDAAVPGLNRENAYSQPVLLPPLSTQRAIADYLDAETARIDALIAAKENLLAILAEKRKVLVTQAVTRGLDPDVPMRDSGLPWLGEIPAHWAVVPLRFLVRFQSGGTPSKSNRDYWYGDVPWVSPKDMKMDRISDSADHITALALKETNLSMVPVGTVLLVVRGMILAHTIPVAVTMAPVTINQDMKALRCSPRLVPSFLHATLQGAARWFLANTGESSHGTKKLETEVIGRFSTPVPPLQEQRAIVTHVSTQIRRLDDLATANHTTIKLLKERREALIAAAVTGQLDIPEATA